MCNDNIPPLELQIEIMKRLPVRKLIQSRSVSKSWKSIIDGIKFISDYNSHAHHHQQLLISFYKQTKVYIVNDDDDDNSFSQHKVSLSLPLSCQPSFYHRNNMIGYSQGLFAFYNYDASTKPVAVIWNPSIRKSVDVPVPNVLQWPYETVFGFSVCNATDPIIVKINNIASIEFDTISSIPWQVEVFTLSSGAWRSLSDSNSNSRLPRKSLKVTRKSVVIDRFIYWIATDRNRPPVDDIFLQNTLVLSFDITSEVFTEISLPPSLAYISQYDLYLSKLSESLVVLEVDVEAEQQEYGVWIMDVGVQNSFRKLYTVKAPEASILRVLGFRENGRPIIEIQHDSFKQTPLSVYEPESERFIDTGIYGNGYACFAGSYVATLLLLDYCSISGYTRRSLESYMLPYLYYIVILCFMFIGFRALIVSNIMFYLL